jgi:hypothetical protein
MWKCTTLDPRAGKPCYAFLGRLLRVVASFYDGFVPSQNLPVKLIDEAPNAAQRLIANRN